MIVIAKRSICDYPTGLIELPWKFKKLQQPGVIAAAAVIGLTAFSLRA